MHLDRRLGASLLLLASTGASCAVLYDFDDYEPMSASSTGGGSATSSSTGGGGGGGAGGGGTGGGTTSTTTGVGGMELPDPWGHRFGGEGADTVVALDVDDDGSVVILGIFHDTIELGGQPLEGTPGALNLFVEKRNPAGAHLWSRYLGASVTYVGGSVAFAESGSVVLAGYFDGTVAVDFDPVTALGVDAFVAKLSPAGDLLWGRRAGDAAWQALYDVDADATGRIAVSGYFQSLLDLCPAKNLSTTVPNFDVVVAELAPNGACLWNEQYGDGFDQFGLGVALAPEGSVIATGRLDGGTTNFGQGVLVGTAGSDTFAAKLGPGGVGAWAVAVAEAGGQGNLAPRVGPDGDVFLSGLATGALHLDPDQIPLGGFDIVAARLDGDTGAPFWARLFGGAGTDFGELVPSPSGFDYLAGYLDQPAMFGAFLLTPLGTDVFVAAIDEQGIVAAADRYGDESGQGAVSARVGPGGRLVVAGNLSGTVDFGQGPLTAAGPGPDVFLVSIDPPGP